MMLHPFKLHKEGVIDAFTLQNVLLSNKSFGWICLCLVFGGCVEDLHMIFGYFGISEFDLCIGCLIYYYLWSEMTSD